jgi:hypothetical protein
MSEPSAVPVTFSIRHERVEIGQSYRRGTPSAEEVADCCRWFMSQFCASIGASQGFVSRPSWTKDGDFVHDRSVKYEIPTFCPVHPPLNASRDLRAAIQIS